MKIFFMGLFVSSEEKNLPKLKIIKKMVLCFLPCICVIAGDPLPLYLLHENKKRFAIVLPLLRQLVLVRKFVTTHIHRQLKAVGVQIAKIIHTCQEREKTVGKHQLKVKTS